MKYFRRIACESRSGDGCLPRKDGAGEMTKFDQSVNAQGVQFKKATRQTPTSEYMFRMVGQAVTIGGASWLALLLMCPLIDKMHPRHRRDRRYHPIWKPLAILIPIVVGALTLRGCLG